MGSDQAEVNRQLKHLRFLHYLHSSQSRANSYYDVDHNNNPSRRNTDDDDDQEGNYYPKYLNNKGNRLLPADPTMMTRQKRVDEQRTIVRCVTGLDACDYELEKGEKPHIVNDNESRANIEWNAWLMQPFKSIASNERAKSV